MKPCLFGCEHYTRTKDPGKLLEHHTNPVVCHIIPPLAVLLRHTQVSYEVNHIPCYIIYTKSPTSLHPIISHSSVLSTRLLASTPLGSLCVCRGVARHSNPQALTGRTPRCSGCRSAGAVKLASGACTAEFPAGWEWS